MFLKSSDAPYITSIEIENVKCFKEKQLIDFSDESGRIYQWNILLGDNGTGKTTLLRSLYMTNTNHFRWDKKRYISLLNFESISSILITYYVESEENVKEFITAKKEKNTLNIESLLSSSSDDWDFPETGINHFIAYGANRFGEKEEYVSPFDESTLVDDDAKLINVEGYFINLDYLRNKEASKKSEREYNIVKDILKKVLPDVSDIRIITKGRRPFVEFQMQYGWIKYQDLSLGYQTVTAWMVDLAVRMFERFSRHKDPLAQPAVVMVDEIDLHMHPRWQQKIMRHLSEQFPKIQFIVTAHSPLIVQSATNANVIVLKRQGNQVVVDNDPVSVKNWRIDQILASDMFGVSMRDEETTQKLNRRKVLLQKEKLTANEKKELVNLEKEAASLPTSESPEMIKAMELIKQVANNLKK
ncbi:MAG: AAA family ATPase [Arcicella sp.]|nr:AAA family ATPase [Arcicella sp.]